MYFKLVTISNETQGGSYFSVNNCELSYVNRMDCAFIRMQLG